MPAEVRLSLRELVVRVCAARVSAMRSRAVVATGVRLCASLCAVCCRRETGSNACPIASRRLPRRSSRLRRRNRSALGGSGGGEALDVLRQQSLLPLDLLVIDLLAILEGAESVPFNAGEM